MSSSSRLKFNKWEAESSFLKKLLHHVQKPYVDLCCSFWCSKLRRTTLIFDGYTTAGYWSIELFRIPTQCLQDYIVRQRFFISKNELHEQKANRWIYNPVKFRVDSIKNDRFVRCWIAMTDAGCVMSESEEVISWPASGDLCELIKWSASRSGQQEINKTFRLQL